MVRKLGRNDLCHCGSDKKYKRCCLEQDRIDAAAPPVPATELGHEIQQALGDREFESMEDAQAFVTDYMHQRNSVARADFRGLSSEQMAQLLYHPWESPGLLSFEAPTTDRHPPVLRLFQLLVDALGETGLKATAKGNLPRNFCREAARVYWGEEEYAERTQVSGIRTETDFDDLHTLRLVARMAGLLRKHKGRFLLTRRCRDSLSVAGLNGVYLPLLQAYTQRFNWAYRDGFPEFAIIQLSFAFIFYLLSLDGDEPRHETHYAEAFIRAFPAVLQEAEQGRWASSPEDQVSRAFRFRMVPRFLGFFGLARLDVLDPAALYFREYQLSKGELLDQVVRFRV
ncbi:YecA family protein [Alkalilimnicola sp. S0819]|uniref:YecA family protein n=1 Tax=Alkalilimnicola sp. S0819 TaxID=2613922 RepID=UPI0012619614|nr:SEC-C domain-containing protein [Alkalilimnicola sp. S0819]KAB7627278.1 SEC-C domain-containing protein [Alkalilimnicola sp. S0819]MPQ15991.1 hypothetical protein [Alkalilimnicola sp. S0819]